MKYMPEFIQATYSGEGKNDYALKAKITMEGLAAHPEEAEYIYAYAACFLHIAKQEEACVAHCFKYLPQITIWDCREDTLNALTGALEALNKFSEAIEIRKQMLEEAQTNTPGQVSLDIREIAEAYEQQADYKNAIAYYEMLDEKERDGNIYEKMATLYEKIKDFNNAAANYLKAAQHYARDSAWYWSNTGRTLALAGKEDESKFYFEVALKIDPQDAYSHYYMGVTYQNKGDVYRALHHYTEALKIQPEFPEVYTNLGAICFNEEGDIKGAIENIETALQQNPDTNLLVRLYLNLSQLYKKISDYDNHEYYKAKMLQTIGFDVEMDDEEEDDDDDNFETDDV